MCVGGDEWLSCKVSTECTVPTAVLGTTQVLYQNKIFSWPSIIYHNVCDKVSQNIIIINASASYPGCLREPKAKCGDQKDDQRSKRQKDEGKNSQESIFCLIITLSLWDSAEWEPLPPLCVIHLLCGCRFTHSWILPLLIISVIGEQTRWVKCVGSVGRLPGFKPLFYLLARKLLKPQCPSFLISQMEEVIQMWFNGVIVFD